MRRWWWVTWQGAADQSWFRTQPSRGRGRGPRPSWGLAGQQKKVNFLVYSRALSHPSSCFVVMLYGTIKNKSQQNDGTRWTEHPWVLSSAPRGRCSSSVVVLVTVAPSASTLALIAACVAPGNVPLRASTPSTSTLALIAARVAPGNVPLRASTPSTSTLALIAACVAPGNVATEGANSCRGKAPTPAP
jgi:hypothetical protein